MHQITWRVSYDTDGCTQPLIQFVGPANLHFNKLPDHADAAGLWTTLLEVLTWNLDLAHHKHSVSDTYSMNLIIMMMMIIITDTVTYLMASYSPFNTQLRGYLLSVVFPNLHSLQTELLVLLPGFP